MACVPGKMNPPKCIWEICIRLCSSLPYAPPVLITLWCGEARGSSTAARTQWRHSRIFMQATLSSDTPFFSNSVTRGGERRLPAPGAADPFVRACIWGRANARIKINWIHVVFRWRSCLVTGSSFSLKLSALRGCASAQLSSTRRSFNLVALLFVTTA